jgi:formylmethanofuran dehydrogenase subunit A
MNENTKWDVQELGKIVYERVHTAYYATCEILKKYDKEVSSDLEEPLKQFTEQMVNKYTFSRKDFWEKNEKILQRHAVIDHDMYEWALENVTL